MKQKIVLIDTNNIAYRAFYALPDTITTSSGIVTNAVLGFTNMFLKLIEDYRPDIIICAFDSKGPTFRHKIFDEYKMHRKKMPDELGHQLLLIREVMEAFNVRCIGEKGMEADDILASITKKVVRSGDKALIVTGDKDMLQLVTEDIKVLSSKRSITDTITFDVDGVTNKFGVGPEKVRDLLSLMGDSSDNIPGVPGIGYKTATKLIKEFGSVDDIYKNIDRIKSEKLRNILTNNIKMVKISKELVSLKDDIEIDPEVFQKSFKSIKYSKIKKVFEQLEFNTLLKRLPKYSEMLDFKERNTGSLVIEIPRIGLINFEREPVKKELDSSLYMIVTEGDTYQCELIIYFGGENAYLVDNGSFTDGKTARFLKTIMENPRIKKTGINLKQAIKFFKRKNISVNGRLSDLEIMYLALNPMKTSASVSEIAIGLLKIDPDGLKFSGDGSSVGRVIRPEETQMSLNFTATGTSIAENKKDRSPKKYRQMLKNLSLFKDLEHKLDSLLKEKELVMMYENIEEPFIKILAGVELTGVALDTRYLKQLVIEYDIELKKLTKEIHRLCGENFNVNSSQQLSKILYEKLKLPALKKTKTGFSTDARVLKAIKHESPVITRILDYREKNKLKNTYLDVFPNLIDPEDGRVHTNYNQMGTTTGRISSSDPNLQNIPVRTIYGRQIRKAFIPGKGYDILMASDYSQIELRILAHLSGDQNMIDSFNREEDIHDRTASEVFNVDYKKVPENFRRKAKAINFGIIYGMTEFGLASRLAIPGEEAKDYIKRYFERYPLVEKYIRKLINSAVKNGYSSTMFGRKRYIKELGSSNARIRGLGERFAVNTPIQGSAADIMKLSTIQLHKKLVSKCIDSNIILHVHDEIVLELKKRDKNTVEKIIRKSMEDVLELKVKLKVDIKTGKNWCI